MAKITYEDKVALYENEEIADINKCNASDMNEIKHTINGINDGTDIIDNLVVGSIRTKNMFDASTLIQGDIKGDSPTLRISSRQALWLEPGTYTFSSDLTSVYRFALQVQNVGKPPLSTYPTYIYESGWQTTSQKTFTINTGGWFDLLLSKVDNTAFSSTDIENLYSFDYQLEKGDTATAYSPYQNLDVPQPTVLWSGSQVITAGDVISLNDSVANYKYIEVFYGIAAGSTKNTTQFSRRFDATPSKNVMLSGVFYSAGGLVQPFGALLNFSGTTMTLNRLNAVNINASSLVLSAFSDFGITLLRIIGYK